MKTVARPRKGERADRCKTWLLVWELPHAKGERLKPLTETFHGTKGEAEERWRQQQAKIESRKFVAPTKETVGQYMDRWLAAAAPDLQRTTAESYARIVRTHIVPDLGDVALSDLTPTAVQEWVNALRTRPIHRTARKREAEQGSPPPKPLSSRTVSYARTVLRIALQEAVRLGALADNPVDRTRAPKQAPRHVEAFTVAQVAALLDRASSARLRHLLEFAWLTGLRRGELLALRWADVDLDAGTATIRRSLVAVRGGSMEKAPKSESGTRVVALPARAVEALRREHASQSRDKLNAGPAYEDRGYVFATALGGPLGPTNVSRDFRRLRDAAGLPPLPFHALRHTAVSVQLAAGVPLETVSKRIGHRKLGTTADIYGHLLPEANRGAAAAVDAFLNGEEGRATTPHEVADVTGHVTGTPRNAADGAPRGERRTRGTASLRRTL